MLSATWYVTFEVHKHGLLRKRRSPRETRTFASEDDAKRFARERLEEGLSLFAGTLNPHVPKRVIPANHVAAWLSEKPAETTDLPAPQRHEPHPNPVRK